MKIQKKKGDRTKEALIESALDLFLKSGVNQVSFNRIASRLKMTQASLYVYFEHKEALILECCRYVAREAVLEMEKVFDLTVPADRQLFLWIQANLSWAKNRPPNVSIILSAYYFGTVDSSFREFFLELEHAAQQKILSYLYSGAREGIWDGESLELKAQQIHSLIIGEMIKSIYGLRPPKVAKHMDELFSAVISILMPSRLNKLYHIKKK